MSVFEPTTSAAPPVPQPSEADTLTFGSLVQGAEAQQVQQAFPVGQSTTIFLEGFETVGYINILTLILSYLLNPKTLTHVTMPTEPSSFHT